MLSYEVRRLTGELVLVTTDNEAAYEAFVALAERKVGVRTDRLIDGKVCDTVNYWKAV